MNKGEANDFSARLTYPVRKNVSYELSSYEKPGGKSLRYVCSISAAAAACHEGQPAVQPVAPDARRKRKIRRAVGRDALRELKLRQYRSARRRGGRCQ